MLGHVGSILWAGLLLYMGYNYIRRDARRRKMEAIFASRYALSDSQESNDKKRMIRSGLKGVRDAQRILRPVLYYDMPFATFTALEFALFKTYGIPTISSLLLRTGQLSKTENASRRFVDTSVLISAMTLFPLPQLDLEDNDTPEEGDELIARDWTDPRSAIAIARINYLHGRWRSKVSNDDLLYTASLFVLEPIDWCARYEWRPFTPLEQEALFTVWRHASRCMGITGFPDTLAELRSWAESYEKAHMVYEPSNQQVAKYTVDLLLYAIPKALHGPLHNVVYALLNSRLRESFGFPKPPRWLEDIMPSVLAVRSFFSLFLWPQYKVPRSIAPSDAQDKIIQGLSSVCPASGVTQEQAADQGKQCPVCTHASTSDDLLAAWRLAPGWIENAPHYSEVSKPGSLHAMYERYFIEESERHGSAKWQNKELQGKARGFRLEEAGPVGLELSGRKEVLENAIRLNGGKSLQGPWAFQLEVNPVHLS